jgi:hypothetical protein
MKKQLGLSLLSVCLLVMISTACGMDGDGGKDCSPPKGRCIELWPNQPLDCVELSAGTAFDRPELEIVESPDDDAKILLFVGDLNSIFSSVNREQKKLLITVDSTESKKTNAWAPEVQPKMVLQLPHREFLKLIAGDKGDGFHIVDASSLFLESVECEAKCARVLLPRVTEHVKVDAGTGSSVLATGAISEDPSGEVTDLFERCIEGLDTFEAKYFPDKGVFIEVLESGPSFSRYGDVVAGSDTFEAKFSPDKDHPGEGVFREVIESGPSFYRYGKVVNQRQK